MIAILRTIVEPNCTFVLRIAISHAGAILGQPWLPRLPEQSPGKLR